MFIFNSHSAIIWLLNRNYINNEKIKTCPSDEYLYTGSGNLSIFKSEFNALKQFARVHPPRLLRCSEFSSVSNSVELEDVFTLNYKSVISNFSDILNKKIHP